LTASLDVLDDAVWGWLDGAARPLILGLCGAQGSGKSTLSEGLAARLREDGLAVAVLSLDDLYLSQAERAVRAMIHPLFATRGVPGTHDVDLGFAVLDAVGAGRAVALPRFDKSVDEPCPAAVWPVAPADLDLLIFEGWCVGARPQNADELVPPVNALEAVEDTDSVWRRAVNLSLETDYAALFSRLDRLVLLAAPGFEVVERWRTQQEHDLRLRLAAEGRTGDAVMTDAAVARFIQHYERLTRHILNEMPARADLVLRLDEDRQLKGPE
jgi:D-glycerate 3-kinase